MILKFSVIQNPLVVVAGIITVRFVQSPNKNHTLAALHFINTQTYTLIDVGQKEEQKTVATKIRITQCNPPIKITQNGANKTNFQMGS